MAQEDVIDVPMLVLIFVVGTLLTLVTIVGVQSLYYATEKKVLQERVVDVVLPELTRLQEEQRDHLTGYRVVDKDLVKVAIPIDVAMELIAKERAAAR